MCMDEFTSSNSVGMVMLVVLLCYARSDDEHVQNFDLED
jgi:hypothetical protein